MVNYYKRSHRQRLKIIFLIMLITAMILALCACKDSDYLDDGGEIREPTVAADEGKGGINEDGTEAAEAGKGDSVNSSAGTASGDTDSGDIGASKAKIIALAKVPGANSANITEFEREYDDGRLEYEGSIYYNGYEYEFEIDGSTGNVLKWEIDD